MSWRVGRKVGRTLYLNDVLVGMMDTPELAESVVRSLESLGAPSRPAKPMTDAEENATCWMEVALVHGYNDLVKDGRTLGEKLYFRMMRDQAQTIAERLGATFNREAVPGAVVFTMKSTPPFVIFHERDIEGMRAAVAAWDKAHE